MKFIVARWSEDVTWTERVDADVVQKDVDMPNEGREPASFLWWIDRHYDGLDPAGTYVFLQGWPFDHWPHPLGIGDVESFMPLGVLRFACDGNGAPHHPGVPVALAHERWLGPWPGQAIFWAGGQFAVPGSAILARPVDWYRAVFNDLLTFGGLWPWALERLWPAVFGGAV